VGIPIQLSKQLRRILISGVHFLFLLSIILILTIAANHRTVQGMQIRSLQPLLVDFGNFTSNSFNQTLLPPITISPQNASIYQDSIGTTHIVGVVTNPFTFPIRSVQVTASAHNAQNQLISTGSTYTNIDQLNPKEKAGFDIIFLNNVVANPPNYQLSVSYEKADSIKPPALYLYMGQTSMDSAGTYHLLGEVTNLGSNPTSFVEVYGIFFDSNKRVIDVEHTFTTPSELQPGQKAPFDLTISNPNSNLIRFETIDVDSEDYSLLTSNPLLGQLGK
jgi:hypothetical protein